MSRLGHANVVILYERFPARRSYPLPTYQSIVVPHRRACSGHSLMLPQFLANTRFAKGSGNGFIFYPENLNTRVNTCCILVGKIGDSMRFSESIKLLKDDGWVVARSGEKHDLYSHPDKPGILIPVSRHKTEDMKPGTLASIMKDAGLIKS